MFLFYLNQDCLYCYIALDSGFRRNDDLKNGFALPQSFRRKPESRKTGKRKKNSKLSEEEKIIEIYNKKLPDP